MSNNAKLLVLAGLVIVCVLVLVLTDAFVPSERRGPVGPPLHPSTTEPARGMPQTTQPASAQPTTEPARAESPADDWKGYDAKYSLDPGARGLTIESGMAVNQKFQWAHASFSFEFLDRADLVWGFRLMDSTLQTARREALSKKRIKIGPDEYVLGEKLPPDSLLKFDTILEAVFRTGENGAAYRVLDTVWYPQMEKTGLPGVQMTEPRDTNVKKDGWNTVSVTVGAEGKVSYTLNGATAADVFQVDARANGPLGLFVQAGGPLQIRNLKLE